MEKQCFYENENGQCVVIRNQNFLKNKKLEDY